MTGKKICILGFAFKANTNDTRESSAISICKDLLQEGANLFIHDPKVSSQQIASDLLIEENKDLGSFNDTSILNIEGAWSFVRDIDGCFKNADAIVILTEWEEYFCINWGKASKLMRQPAWVFDVRSVLSRERISKYNFNLWRIGDGT